MLPDWVIPATIAGLLLAAAMCGLAAALLVRARLPAIDRALSDER
jgi:hypothetical protein